jgi:hypothetical protein
MHASGTHLHSVHDLVDLVHDQPGDPCLGMRKRLRKGLQTTSPKPLTYTISFGVKP